MLVKKLLTCGLLLVTLFVSAQKSKPEKFAKTITVADLKKHLYILAGPGMEGRETATEGQRKAAAYIENHFRRLGLKPIANNSYQQAFTLYQDTLLDATLEVNGHRFQLGKDFNVSVDNSIQSTQRFSEVVVISGDAVNSLQSMDVAGKLILVLNAGNENRQAAAERQNFLRSKGAAAILTTGSEFLTNSNTRKSGMTIHAFKKAVAPQQFFVSENVTKAILNGEVEAKTSYNKVHDAKVLLEVKKGIIELQSTNVAGIVEGSDLKEEYLVITAHYDHLGKRDTLIYYGADDDGSGTVGILELAEAFAQAKAAGKGPRRSIVFMAVSGEEKGLLGSEYYAAKPLLPLEKTTANLNIDMIGRIDPKRTTGDSTNYVYVIGDDKLSSDLRVISEAANKKYTNMELDYK